MSDVTPADAGHQGESAALRVTPMTAAERKRRQRERQRQAKAIQFTCPDWRDFCRWDTLARKAGCQPGDLLEVVLKELVDNALDADPQADVALVQEDGWWVCRDDGPGIDSFRVPDLFAVNRPYQSTKRGVRIPTRGMLGNGLRVVMGAVAATGGELVVESRGHRFVLTVSADTGRTVVVADTLLSVEVGTIVRLRLPGVGITGNSTHMAKLAIAVASHGKHYTGASSPFWYSPKDLRQQFVDAPEGTTVTDICRNLGFKLDDTRLAVEADAKEILQRLCADAKPVPPAALGYVGNALYNSSQGYHRTDGITMQSIPYVIEVWAWCKRPKSRGAGSLDAELLINRTPTTTRVLTGSSNPDGIYVQGGGMVRHVPAPTGEYAVTVSIIAPYIALTSEGKAPSLTAFGGGIAEALGKACRQAHHSMEAPGGMNIKDAAWSVMEKAYLAASGNGTYPANARQIMYAARPDILRLIGKDRLNDKYFTGVLLPDYVEAHPEQCAGWDVVFDARGSFQEPHTSRTLDLGTIEVRTYLGERAPLCPAVEISHGELFPTHGPRHRYRSVLFIEKEGFGPLLEQAGIAEQFDIAIMSTKGMSVTAARRLLDGIHEHVDQVLVMHDFDVTGFSIFGTLGTDGRRYTFHNELKMVDIGLRLVDVEAMALESEGVNVEDFQSRIPTLRRHGATDKEIEFLQSKRIELNAMTSQQFIDFLTRKLTEHEVEKVIPKAETLEAHARRVIEQNATKRVLDTFRDDIAAEVAAYVMPDDLHEQVEEMLQEHPSMSWDAAVAKCLAD